MLHRNVGGLDRTVRLVLGVVLFPAGLLLMAARSDYGLIVTILGGMGLLSGATAFCILYVPFGFSTRTQVHRERSA